MGLRPSRIVTLSVLKPTERARVLAVVPFKSSSAAPGDAHLVSLGIFREAGNGVALTRAGRVVRRLLQELQAC
jgi:hypothetical protein